MLGRADDHLGQTPVSFPQAWDLFSKSPREPQSSTDNATPVALSPRSIPAPNFTSGQLPPPQFQALPRAGHHDVSSSTSIPRITEQDRAAAIDFASRLGLLQQNGLMQQYLECYVPELLKSVYSIWAAERRDLTNRKLCPA